MVEKVFISPNRVRAYGNIINMKTGDDFTLVNSELTVTTDTVDGAEMTVFSMECEPHISLTATNPYMLSGETTDLVVSLVNEFGSPVRGKTVTVTGSDGSLYNGITNSQGIYTLYNVEVSSDTTFTATYGTVTASTTVYYCQFADLTGDTSLYTASNVTATSSNNEITLTRVSGNYGFWANKPGTTSSEYDYSGDFTVEFDVVSISTNGVIQIYDNSASTFYQKYFSGLGISSACHVKIVKDGQTFKTYVDGTELTSQQVSSNITGACRVGFRSQATGTLTFKNLVIY